MRQRMRQYTTAIGSVLFVAAIASIGVTSIIVGLRLFGALEWLELLTYDWLLSQRPVGFGWVGKQAEMQPDSRILVVGITEADIQAQRSRLQFPDQVYADLLAKISAAKPRVIGLDIWRDQPVEPGHGALVQELQRSDRIYGITFLGSETQPNIQPPQALPRDQIGFNDVLVDRDGVIRRALLYQPGEDGVSLASFSLQIAQRYLLDQAIDPEPSLQNPRDLKLGQGVFPRLQPMDGGYAQVESQIYQIMLNYRGGTTPIPQVSLGDVMSGRTPPSQIRDRIILIGNVAESGKDFFNTPFSKEAERRTPGVIVHAQMTSQYLDVALGLRPLIWSWPEFIEVAWIWGWSLLGGILAWRLQRPVWLLLVTPLSAIALGTICWFGLLHAGWIPLVPPGLGLVSTLGIVVAYAAQQSQRQQQMVMRLLGQSTSPEVAETLWQRRDELLENGKLPGQQLTATLLFTDLRGFSTISEQHAPEQLLAWLNEYLDVMAQTVQQHQGVINKFTGDGIMAVFGVPIAHELPHEIQQDARNAVDCAIAMGQALDELNAGWLAQGLPKVEMRVGIFTGPVVAGSLGSRIRLEYGVIGDGVNIASRLESLDKDRQPCPCRILIAQQTRDCLPNGYQLESWGKMSLKGKTSQVEVFRVIGYSS